MSPVNAHGARLRGAARVLSVQRGARADTPGASARALADARGDCWGAMSSPCAGRAAS